MIKVNEYIHLEDDIVLHFKFIEIKSFLSSTKIIWGFEIKVIIIKNVYFTNYAFIYDLNLYLNLAEDIINYLK